MIDFGNAGPIMRIGVTDASSGDANQNVVRTDFRNWNVCILERFSDLSELYRSHDQNSSLVTVSE